MRNRGFPETQSPGTFVSAPPQQEKEKVGAIPGGSVITGKTESNAKVQAEGKFYKDPGTATQTAC
jgi:hypothetical protein